MESVASLQFTSIPSPFHLNSHKLFIPTFSFPPLPFKSLSTIHQAHTKLQKNEKTIISTKASSKDNAASDFEERWMLEPVGDGDSRHIGFKVALPGAFEIASDVVTVGRLPDKADMVIPVATVSGVHARFKKKGGNLLITDMDSTNGTFINEKRLTPGVVSVVPPGSLVTFGDTNLAIFRVSKVEVPMSERLVAEEEESKTELGSSGLSNDKVEIVS